MAGTATRLIADWTADGGPRQALYGQVKGLVLRWLNEAQLRFADKSEVLQGVWEPDIDSDGYIALPEDFLREVKDRVKWSADKFLYKGSYPILRTVTLSNTVAYCIWDNKFYVFSASSGSPTVPYIKKPQEISSTALDNADLEIPTEYHHLLILYFDAMFARRNGDYQGYIALLGSFDAAATDAGIEFRNRRDNVPFMQGGVL